MLRGMLEAVIRRYGYELKRIGAPLRGYEGFLAHCKRRGLQVETVLDAGVGYGTPWLYDAFPDAQLVLFEPVEKFVPVLEDLKRSRNASYHCVALGAQAGKAQINVAQDFTTASSLRRNSETLLSAVREQGSERTYRLQDVEIKTLDELNTYEAPYLLKLDVEGFELNALQGATRTLQSTELVILEASLLDRYEDGESFLDIYKHLDGLGFAFYEFIEVGTRTLDAPISFFDAAFVPKNSKLRS